MYAIEYAFRYMESTDSKQVLVGGVDCFRDHLLLAKLDSDERILTNGALDGFACAEGAGFLLLSKDPCRYEKSDKAIRLFPPGTDMEKGALYSDEPYQGEGLSRAVSQALQSSRHTNISKIYSSMNGEQYWAKELGVMMARNASAFASNVDIEHPADLQCHRGSHPKVLYNDKVKALLKDLQDKCCKYCEMDIDGNTEFQMQLMKNLNDLSRRVERKIKSWRWLLRPEAEDERKESRIRFDQLN